MSTSRPSSPALRPLQITNDGKTLVGRSPASKLIEKSSPLVRNPVKENSRQGSKITSYFLKGSAKALKQLHESPATKDSVKEPNALANRVDVAVSTELQLSPDLEDEKIVREKLYNTGPKLLDPDSGKWMPYWETYAKDLRRRLDDALLEKYACDDEIESLLEEKRRLQEELEEYKEYFELREYSKTILGEDDD